MRRRGIRSVEHGESLGFVYGEEVAETTNNIIDKLEKNDLSGWSDLKNNPHLLINVLSILRSSDNPALRDYANTLYHSEMSKKTQLNEARRRARHILLNL